MWFLVANEYIDWALLGVDGDFIKNWPIVGCQLSIAEMML